MGLFTVPATMTISKTHTVVHSGYCQHIANCLATCLPFPTAGAVKRAFPTVKGAPNTYWGSGRSLALLYFFFPGSTLKEQQLRNNLLKKLEEDLKKSNL